MSAVGAERDVVYERAERGYGRCVPKRIARYRRHATVLIGGVGATTSAALLVGAVVARLFTTGRSAVVALVVVSILVAATGGILVAPYLDRAGEDDGVRGRPARSSMD